MPLEHFNEQALTTPGSGESRTGFLDLSSLYNLSNDLPIARLPEPMDRPNDYDPHVLLLDQEGVPQLYHPQEPLDTSFVTTEHPLDPPSTNFDRDNLSTTHLEDMSFLNLNPNEHPLDPLEDILQQPLPREPDLPHTNHLEMPTTWSTDLQYLSFRDRASDEQLLYLPSQESVDMDEQLNILWQSLAPLPSDDVLPSLPQGITPPPREQLELELHQHLRPSFDQPALSFDPLGPFAHLDFIDHFDPLEPPRSHSFGPLAQLEQQRPLLNQEPRHETDEQVQPPQSSSHNAAPPARRSREKHDILKKMTLKNQRLYHQYHLLGQQNRKAEITDEMREANRLYNKTYRVHKKNLKRTHIKNVLKFVKEYYGIQFPKPDNRYRSIGRVIKDAKSAEESLQGMNAKLRQQFGRLNLEEDAKRKANRFVKDPPAYEDTSSESESEGEAQQGPPSTKRGIIETMTPEEHTLYLQYNQLRKYNRKAEITTEMLKAYRVYHNNHMRKDYRNAQKFLKFLQEHYRIQFPKVNSWYRNIGSVLKDARDANGSQRVMSAKLRQHFDRLIDRVNLKKDVLRKAQRYVEDPATYQDTSSESESEGE